MIPTEERVSLHNWISFIVLLIIQTQSGFNITSSQFLLVPMAHALHAEHYGQGQWWFNWLTSYQIVVTVILLLPYIFFSSMAGWLADRWPKTIVIQVMLGLQILGMSIIYLGLKVESLGLATAGFFVLSMHAAFFSPAKLAIVKEFVGSKKLTLASGWMEMLVILGILAGTISMGPWFDKRYHKLGESAWDSAQYYMGWLWIAALIAPLVFLAAAWKPAQSSTPFTWDLFTRQIKDVRELFHHRVVRLAALGVGFWWFFGGFVKLMAVQISGEGIGGTMGTEMSRIMMFISIGIAVGSALSSWICWSRNELGLVPLGAFGMSFGLVFLAILPLQSTSFYFALGVSGLLSALFLVPLNAFLQDEVPADKRGRLLAASNLLNCVGGLVAAIIHGAITFLSLTPNAEGVENPAHWAIPAQFVLLAVLCFLASLYIMKLLPQHFLRMLMLAVVRFLYRVRVLNPQHEPKTGGALLVSNHVSYADAVMIGAVNQRMVRFVVYQEIYHNRWLHWFFRMFGAVPISPSHAKDAIRTTAAAVKEGSLVCIFPEGMLTRSGMMNQSKKGFEIIARQSDAPVVPIYLDGLWDSIMSFERGLYFKKSPRRVPVAVTASFGPPIPPGEATTERLQREWYRLGAEAFTQRRELKLTLGQNLAKALRGSRPALALADEKGGRSVLSARELGRRTRALAKKYAHLPTRVGVALHSSSSSVLVLLALWQAKKVPVLLPASAPSKLEETRQKHGLACILIDQADETHGLPALCHWKSRQNWPKSDSSSPANPKPTELRACEALAWLVPDGSRLGSATHYQLIGMVQQLCSVHLLLRNEAVYNALPFATLGATIYGLLWPLLFKVPLCLDQRARAAAPANWKIGPLVASAETPSPPVSARFTLIPGAQPIPVPAAAVASAGENISPLPAATVCTAWVDEAQGHLLTLNLPDEALDNHDPTSVQLGMTPGSVGRLLPGLQADWSDAKLTGSLRVQGVTTNHEWRSALAAGHEDAEKFVFAS